MSASIPVPMARLMHVREALDRAATELEYFESWDKAKAARVQANLLNEEISIARDHAPVDFEALLGRAIEAIGLYTGQAFAATADEHGTDAAILALESAAPALAPPVDDRDAWLRTMREAVRVQDPVCTVEVLAGSRTDKIVSKIEDYAVPRIPVEGDHLRLPGSSGARLARVVRVIMDGRAAIVRVKVWGTLAAEESF